MLSCPQTKEECRKSTKQKGPENGKLPKTTKGSANT